MQERDYYADPERYEAEVALCSADIPWYLSRTLQSGGPALVLGCGSGRVLMHLANAAIEVDGLDTAPAMLDRARTRALLLPPDQSRRIRFFQADMRDFSLPGRYQTVLAPLNVLMHLHTDDEMLDCLRCVRHHLHRRGRFFFDVTRPREEILETFGEPGGIPVREIRAGGNTYLQKERHRFDRSTGISETLFTYEPRSDGAEPFVCRLRLRMYSPEQIDRLLARGGFAVVERRVSFGDTGVEKDSLTQILVTRPA